MSAHFPGVTSIKRSAFKRCCMNKTVFVQVITTIDSIEAADNIAQKAVEARLAACAQITGPVDSRYWWQGKLSKAREWQIVFKTRESLYMELSEFIRSCHPYQTPEIIALPILLGDPDYLIWIENETGDRKARQSSDMK